MKHRERVAAALRFERPDRLPCDESFWDGTLQQWQAEGMRADVDAADYFDFDLCWMAMDASPRLEQKILRREGGMITYRDRFGYTATKQDGLSSSIAFSDQVTVDRETWQRLKPRFSLSSDPGEPARIDEASYFAHFDPYPTWDEAAAKYRRLRATGRYMLLSFYGPWEATWRHRAMQRLLMDLVLAPDWFQDMADTYLDLVIDILGRCVELGMKPDGVFMVEDLGSTRAMLFSPATWRALLKPAYARLAAILARHGIDFWMHSCGAIEPVIDDLVEVGLAVLNPLQANAGLDAVALRRRYGRRLAFYGNIDVRKILGSQEELLAELRRKVPLARDGGFVFHSDHSIPPQVGFERYAWMLRTARELFHS
jgi:uroporphyrinogen decarboxylase